MAVTLAKSTPSKYWGSAEDRAWNKVSETEYVRCRKTEAHYMLLLDSVHKDIYL